MRKLVSRTFANGYQLSLECPTETFSDYSQSPPRSTISQDQLSLRRPRQLREASGSNQRFPIPSPPSLHIQFEEKSINPKSHDTLTMICPCLLNGHVCWIKSCTRVPICPVSLHLYSVVQQHLLIIFLLPEWQLSRLSCWLLVLTQNQTYLPRVLQSERSCPKRKALLQLRILGP